jgi:hypothetical protein
LKEANDAIAAEMAEVGAKMFAIMANPTPESAAEGALLGQRMLALGKTHARTKASIESKKRTKAEPDSTTGGVAGE